MENDRESISKEDRELSARYRLAKRLFEAEEFLDPSNTGTWEELSERERSYYEALIGELLTEKRDLCLVLEISKHYFIDRCSNSWQNRAKNI